MASAKVPKSKGKTEDKGKSTKANAADEDLEIDCSLLRKPIINCITNFDHVLKLYELASDECKGVIANECDLLYECKVCRSIFRSLLNLLSHKRVYCKEKFNANDHAHFLRTKTLKGEIDALQKLQRSVEKVPIDPDSRIPLTKDLTALIEEINNKRGVPIEKQNENIQQMTFQKISTTNNAVYQSIIDSNEDNDNMKDQVNEINNMLSQDRAVIQEDGNCVVQNSQKPLQVETDSVILLSDDEDEAQSLVCKICKLQFSTVKTLKFHVKYKHLESRLVYPCPDCVDLFCTSWSVYRHLFKVHRKSAAQIRRMRESIQAKAFKMNNPPAFYEKRKNNVKPVVVPKMTDRERHGQENQAWMDNMEGDSEVPRCGGCGRMFERRAALAAHTNTCQPRNKALTRKHENKKIEIQIRKDYNKTSTNVIPIHNNDSDGHLNELQDVETVLFVGEPAKEKALEKSQSLLANTELPTKDSTNEDKGDNEVIAVEDIVKKVDSAPNLPEQDELEGLKKKMAVEANLLTLTCNLCKIQCPSITKLTTHMAQHHGWRHFQCKICNYKNYVRGRMIKHLMMVHSLTGDEDFLQTTIRILDVSEPMEVVESAPTPNEFTLPVILKTPDDSSKAELGTRKRKISIQVKKKKEKDDENDLISSRSEENSSDFDEIEDKLSKKQPLADEELLSVITSRRPIRKRPKRRNDDFEYDLSNLLKLEAHGYKEVTNTRVAQSKKKVQSEPVSPIREPRKDHAATLLLLSKQAVERSSAKAWKIELFNICAQRNFRTYIKPHSLQYNKESENATPSNTKVIDKDSSDSSEVMEVSLIEEDVQVEDTFKNIDVKDLEETKDKLIATGIQTSSSVSSEQIKNQLPMKFAGKSVELSKTPVNNKNINVPRVIVIKQVNRKKVGEAIADNTLKYPTITFKNTFKEAKTEALKVVKLTPKPPLKAIVDKQCESVTNHVAETITVKQDEYTENGIL